MSDPKNRKEAVDEAIRCVLGSSTPDTELTTRLDEDLGMDSLDRVELVMELEEIIDVEISDSQLVDDKGDPRFRTVGEFLKFLDELLGPEVPEDGNHLELTEEQFDARYLPEHNDDGSLYRQREWDKGPDEAAIKAAIADKRCWTVVEADEHPFVIVWGNRTVNRLYNIITRKPIENEDWHVEAFDPDAEVTEQDEEE